MKTEKNLTTSYASSQAGPTQKYLVLVPHQETRQILKKYSDKLIKNGLKNVYPFPFIAPLAELDKALSPGELKDHAQKLRADMGKEKFILMENGSMPMKVRDKELILYGNKIITQRHSNAAIIIGIFLSDSKDFPLPQPIEVSFRAAAVANFYIKPIIKVGASRHLINGFKWKIGKLYWLPRSVKQVN